MWNLSIHDLGFAAPNLSRIILAHILRAARNFAASSSRLLWATKKKDSLPPKSSTSRPESTAACTYAMALAKVKASSCTAVAPASRMWYPLMLIVFQRGASRLQYPKTSVTSRIEGLGG